MDSSSGSPGHWEYIDFELEILEGGPPNYPVCVRSPEGEVHEQMHFPFDKWELENKLQALEIALLRAGDARRRRIHLPEEQTVQDFGRDLFRAVLDGEMRAHYEVNLHVARQQNKG